MTTTTKIEPATATSMLRGQEDEMSTLEQQLAGIVQTHGLKHLSIHVTDKGEFYAVAHRGKLARYSGALDFNAIPAAITDAIGRLPVAEVTDLAPMGDVA